MADSTVRLPETFVKGFHNEDAVRRMKYNPLGDTGMKVSVLGCGGGPLGGMYGDVHEDEAIQSVRNILMNGVNYIDTAPWYGQGKSEQRIGQALKDVPREAYYMATKVGRYNPKVDEMFDFSAERTLQSVDDSLRYLGLDYVDVIQIHDVEFAKNIDVIVKETLPTLEKVRQAGKARFIGITGYPLEVLREVIEKSTVKIDTVLSYCRYTMNDTSLLDYIPFLKEKGVGVINASPFGMGLLTTGGPQPWIPAQTRIQEACRKAVQYCQSKDVDIAKLAVHFSLSHDAIPITLTGTARAEEMRANLETACGSLSAIESETMEYVLEKFLRPLNNANWTGVELQDYWAKMKELGKA